MGRLFEWNSDEAISLGEMKEAAQPRSAEGADRSERLKAQDANREIGVPGECVVTLCPQLDEDTAGLFLGELRRCP